MINGIHVCIFILIFVSEITLSWRIIAYLLWKVRSLHITKLKFIVVLLATFMPFHLWAEHTHTDSKPHIMGYDLPVIMLLIKSLHAHTQGKRKLNVVKKEEK